MVLLLAGACSKQEDTRHDTRAGDSVVVTSSEPTAPIIVRAAGVRFDPPSTWPKGRYRVEAKSHASAADEQPFAAHWVAIQYQPDEPGSPEASLCRIVVFGRDDWLRIDSESGPPVGTVLESLDAWTYVVQLPQANPYPARSIDAAQFDAMRLSIREVRVRFSIEGGGPSADADEL